MARETEFLSPGFIRALREKCFSYVLATERLYDGRGKRVDTKDLIADPIFRAIHYYRELWLAQKSLQKEGGDLPSWRPPLKTDPKQIQLLTDTMLQAIGAADPAILRRMADLMELNEHAQAKYDFLLRRKDVALPWEYYAGTVALSFLVNGTVPTKEDVRELAIKLRAQASLPARASAKALTEKISEVRKQNPKQWRRIFRKLNLTDLLPW